MKHTRKMKNERTKEQKYKGRKSGRTRERENEITKQRRYTYFPVHSAKYVTFPYHGKMFNQIMKTEIQNT